jgi:hypothetical protein
MSDLMLVMRRARLVHWFWPRRSAFTLNRVPPKQVNLPNLSNRLLKQYATGNCIDDHASRLQKPRLTADAEVLFT